MSDLSFLELVPVLMAMFIWGVKFQNRKILLKIDNQALVIINKKDIQIKICDAIITTICAIDNA
jgi:hypothetical protein